MVRALFDTNILIDYLVGVDAAKAELERYERRSISIITVMEVLVGAKPDAESPVRAWLSTFDLVPLDPSVANLAVTIRKKARIKLPDAIVWASAQSVGALLVSRNTKDFPPDDPGVRVPYQL
ncbi:twitching motility protein PilT [Caballeronia pedi]|uniref:Ribonuclease VapC n=1 Tax=Caballeronia pedi TaxID=1777141 RepID=A0A158AZG3_9BURK|nr:type II toxin-antitoxin system VapC family toxin [Caballeronia pedi]SAK63224.1 twitching motility protein PilT [Caballeronia pedi]